MVFENRHSPFLPRLLCLNVGIYLNAKLLCSYDATEINNRITLFSMLPR